MSKILSKINIFLLFVSMLLLAGCFMRETSINKSLFSPLKGKNISYVESGFGRKPDIIEDWGGFKRYTWRVCKYTGYSEVGVRNNDVSYYKPEKKCCYAQFDIDWSDTIVGYNSEQLKFCPIELDFKK